MKTLLKHLKYIVAGMILSVALSCSDDFLNDGPLPFLSSSPTGEYYAIYVSPEWDAAEFPISCPGAGNAKFSISNVPGWLNISPQSGQFTDGMAYVNCSASVNNEFAKWGTYNLSITINIEGIGKYAIRVVYINEGDPAIVTPEYIELTYGQYEQFLSFYNEGEGLLIWKIVEHPEWINIDLNLNTYEAMLASQTETAVRIKYNENYSLTEEFKDGKKVAQLTGQIVIESNDRENGKKVIEVFFNLGSPVLSCQDRVIDFSRTETAQPFQLWSYGNGILLWQIEECPEWITFSRKSGALPSYNSDELSITCNRTGLPAGLNSAVIKIISNSVENPVRYIAVQCRNGDVNSENIRDIPGTVSDAWFDKSTDLLYLSTKQPNRLLVYDINSRTTVREIILQYVPDCFSVSEDKQKIAVGHEGRISFVDMNLHTVEKVLEVKSTVFDVEWGAGDWCCYTPNAPVQWCNLKWINAASGEHDESSNSGMYGESEIKKIPGQNYIIATRLHISPSDIIVIDSQTRELVNDISENIGHFWFSADGAYLFSASNNIYITSLFPSAREVSPAGGLKFDSKSVCTWIDHNPETNSLWVLRGGYYYNRDYTVWHLETNGYTVVNKFKYENLYMATIGGMYDEYPVDAHYVFANSADTEVIVIKNVEQEYGNAWSLEHVPVGG
jgi:hypothetical protein